MKHLLMGLLLAGAAMAQTTAFTYQGKLSDAGSPANGSYDVQFKLFDTASGGTQQGTTQTIANVAVSNGLFTVPLDFGACASCFNGAARFLEIAVKPTSGGAFTALAPRQPITSTPYALKSLNATAADGLSVACINCVTSSQVGSVNGGAVTGPIPVESVPAGSGNYIQNTTSQQAGSNFNLSGTGTAATFNATTQYNFGGIRILSAPGTNNLFAGAGAGQSNTSGASNAFVGAGAGQANAVGVNDAFFGFNAGRNNVGDAFGNGSDNSFFGSQAGQNNSGSQNSFFGRGAGAANTAGSFNSFFGNGAGQGNAGSLNSFFGQAAGQGNTGSSNSFFGASAGASNTADGNSFVGASAGFVNTSGAHNSFFGAQAGQSNTTQHDNTFIGSGAGLNNGTNDPSGNANFNTFVGSQTGQANTTGQKNAFFGAGAGAAATTDSMNSFFGYNAGNADKGGTNNCFFGNEAGSHNTTGTTNSFFGNAAGFFNTAGKDNSFFGNDAGLRTTGDDNSFFGSTAGFNNNTGIENAFFGYQAGLANTAGSHNNFFGANAGKFTTGFQNNFFGSEAGTNNTTGSNNTVIGDLADVASANLDHATAIGAGAVAPASNQVQIGRNSLDKVSIGLLGTGASTQICMVNSIFSTCSSSRRYKEKIAPFAGSLPLLQRLRPVTFDWKGRKEHDLGLVAEEVFEVEPLLVTRNDLGEIEGVKYDKLTVVLINAVREQQQWIEQARSISLQQQDQLRRQQAQIQRQQSEIDALKSMAKSALRRKRPAQRR